MPPIIDKELCNACGKCVDICPADVFFGSDNGDIPIVSYPDECWHENACVQDCPMGAIKLRIPLQMTVVHKQA
jgi:adenylylsulfate reductase subunit B